MIALTLEMGADIYLKRRKHTKTDYIAQRSLVSTFECSRPTSLHSLAVYHEQLDLSEMGETMTTNEECRGNSQRQFRHEKY